VSTAILIVAPPMTRRRSAEHLGDLFDIGFVDTVRTLAGSGTAAMVLIPWSKELAPLIASATVDTAPSFDPESRAEPQLHLRLYTAPGQADWEPGNAFWRGSYLSLAGIAPVPLPEALRGCQKIFAVVLGKPPRAATLRRMLRASDLDVVTFGSLADPEGTAQWIGADTRRIVDLEQLLPPLPTDETAAVPELAPEEILEPYVPFGLLLQYRFDELLSDDTERPAGAS
jgi:hypothetical protein